MSASVRACRSGAVGGTSVPTCAATQTLSWLHGRPASGASCTASDCEAATSRLLCSGMSLPGRPASTPLAASAQHTRLHAQATRQPGQGQRTARQPDRWRAPAARCRRPRQKPALRVGAPRCATQVAGSVAWLHAYAVGSGCRPATDATVVCVLPPPSRLLLILNALGQPLPGGPPRLDLPAGGKDRGALRSKMNSSRALVRRSRREALSTSAGHCQLPWMANTPTVVGPIPGWGGKVHKRCGSPVAVRQRVRA